MVSLEKAFAALVSGSPNPNGWFVDSADGFPGYSPESGIRQVVGRNVCPRSPVATRETERSRSPDLTTLVRGGKYLRSSPLYPSRAGTSDDFWSGYDNGAFLKEKSSDNTFFCEKEWMPKPRSKPQGRQALR